MGAFVIEYDPIDRNVKFKIRNDWGKYTDIADCEELKYYESTNIFALEGSHDKIFKYIEDNYDEGLKIDLEIIVDQLGFEEKQTEFERFKEAVGKFNSNSNININLIFNKIAPEPQNDILLNNASDEIKSEKNTIKSKMKIAVIGKLNSGKTTLIEGMVEHLDSICVQDSNCSDFKKFIDEKNNTEWYEITGIEFGKEYVAKAIDTLDKLIADGTFTVLYCLNSRIGKIEDIERDLIVNVKRKYPNINIYIVITMCIDKDVALEFADKTRSLTKQTEVFSVLAKELSTKAGYLEPFGLEEITRILYED